MNSTGRFEKFAEQPMLGDYVRQFRKHAAQFGNTFDIFQGAHPECQTISINKLCFGLDDIRPDIRTGAQGAIIAQLDQIAQLIGRDGFSGFDFLIIESVELREHQTISVHQESTNVTVRASVYYRASSNFRFTFIHLRFFDTHIIGSD